MHKPVDVNVFSRVCSRMEEVLKKNKMVGLIALSMTLILTTLTACATTVSTLPEDNQAKAAIYAAVVRQLYTVDHTFGEPPNFPIIYLVEATDDSVGDPDAPKTESNLLLGSIQEAITDALEDLPAEFVWVSGSSEVPRDSNTGVVEGNGAIITLGNVHFQKDESALVSASIFIANLAAGGLTYIVERIDGVWQVVGDTGVRWIS